MKTFEERLAVESTAWVIEGLVTEDQRSAIIQRHPAKTGTPARFIAIVATVGGLLFTVGVSLVIKSNWQAMGDWIKIGGLVFLLVGTYAAGWNLKMADRHLMKTGDACLMMGGLFFLCGIALVSQIFHLNSRPATGLLVWWIGIMAVPLFTVAKGAQFLSVVAGLVWFGSEMTTRGSWIEVGVRASGYGHDEVTLVANYFFLGLALWFSGLGLRGTRWSEFAGLHEKWGVLLTFGSLYWLGFVRHVWRHPQRTGVTLEATSWLAIGIGVGLAGLALLAAWRRSGPEMKSLLPWVALALVPVAGVLGVGPMGDGGWLWSALAWLTLFALAIATVRIGLESGREGWVNLGILCIAANIITRYFDLFGSMLDGGIFFIVTGVLVTGLGIYLEKKRRALLGTLRGEVPS
jgi:uncharacterized membrane protein